MTNETRIAFEHPLKRAISMEGANPPDRISLRDHIVEVEIGAFQAERDVTQRISFNVVVEVQDLPDDVEDDVDRILSYDRVTEAIAFELASERLNLLETLAERVADRILLEPQAVRVFVRIEKLDRGPGALGVEIVRQRGDLAQNLQEAQAGPTPRVVYLGEAALASPHLTAWVDQLEAAAQPAILCVGSAGGALAPLDNKTAQRRIDLLTIEQNAWRLAAKDARCVVVGTRTELDWAMKNGQISVWAPSKIVMDAVDTPDVQPRDAVALSAWFAALMGADEMLVIGADVPKTSPVPLCPVEIGQVAL